MTFQRAIVRNERLFVPSGSRLVVGASSFQRCIFGSTIVCRCIKRPVSQPTIYFRWRIEARRWRWRCSIAGEIQPREPRRPSPLLFPSPAAPLPRIGKCVTRRRSAITPSSSFSSLLPPCPVREPSFHGRKQKLHAPGTPHNEFLFIARCHAVLERGCRSECGFGGEWGEGRGERGKRSRVERRDGTIRSR